MCMVGSQWTFFLLIRCSFLSLFCRPKQNCSRQATKKKKNANSSNFLSPFVSWLELFFLVSRSVSCHIWYIRRLTLNPRQQIVKMRKNKSWWSLFMKDQVQKRQKSVNSRELSWKFSRARKQEISFAALCHQITRNWKFVLCKSTVGRRFEFNLFIRKMSGWWKILVS